MSLEAFFPNGIWSYLIGGLLLGLGVSLIYILTSHIMGASSLLDSFLSLFSNKFERKETKRRLLFLIGIISGGFVYALIFNDFFVTQVSVFRLLIGGLLVGYGVRMGRGCTSGHGICGLSSFSKTSLINVALFMITAIIVAHIMWTLGVRP